MIGADSLNTATPILDITANAFDEDRQTCLDASMNDHIVGVAGAVGSNAHHNGQVELLPRR